jgi:hypothetical protein
VETFVFFVRELIRQVRGLRDASVAMISWRTGISALVLAAGSVASAYFIADTLTDIAPRGASAQLPIHIFGTGMAPAASSNVVTFVPVTGASVAATASNIQTLQDGRQNLTVTVPNGLPIGTTAVRVLNQATGETLTGASFEHIGISLPEYVSAPRGTKSLDVKILGTANGAVCTDILPVERELSSVGAAV